MREGLRAAMEMGYRNLIIEGDNICIIKVFKWLGMDFILGD